MAFLKKSKREITDIEAELQELRQIKKSVESRSAAASNVKVFLAKLWAGPELSKSLEAWMVARDENDAGQTVTATANLIAAILRRLMRVSFIFILLASIPILLIIWQNIIMERQNQSLIRQIQAERMASSNQQVTEYLRLLLSSDERQVTAAEGFLVSDLVNRDLAVERLAALMQSGNSDVQCSALRVLSRIVESASELTLQDAVAPQNDGRAIVADLQCSNMDFTGVDFGAVTFLDVGFPQANFKSADVSDVVFKTSNLRHSDFSETFLCRGRSNCIRFQDDTDLSHARLRLTDYSQSVFRDGMILRAAQLTFDHEVIDVPRGKLPLGGDKQIKNTTSVVPKIPSDNIVASGVCYETTFSQCFLYHKAKDLGQLEGPRLNSLRQNNCPINLEGPIVLTSMTRCETLGLPLRW